MNHSNSWRATPSNLRGTCAAILATGLALIVATSPTGSLGGAPAGVGLMRVTTLLDEDRPAGCTADSCSLREAIALANACHSVSPTRVLLPAGRHELHRIGFDHPRTPRPSTRAPGDSAIVVTGRVRIEGEGAVIARALDAPPFRLFDVAPGALLAFSGVQLSGGLGGAEAGGGIYVREGGVLILDRAQVSGAARLGGGIHAAGTVSMRDTIVRGGRADRGGGLFVTPNGRVRIERSEFLQNLADGMAGFGGAMETQGVVEVDDTAFTGNAARQGSVISVWPPGNVQIRGGLIADNAASQGSGALELLNGDEVVGVRFERNAPRDCVFRYVEDRATRGCPAADPTGSLLGTATGSDAPDPLAER